MTKNGVPLQESHLKFGINTGIKETPAMTEYSAVVAAGVDLWEWEQPWNPEEGRGFPSWFRANVLAWHRSHQLKETHSSDQVAVTQEREGKKRRNK